MRSWVRALTYAGGSPNLGQLGAALWSEPGYWLPEFPNSRCQVYSAADEQQGTRAIVGAAVTLAQITVVHRVCIRGGRICASVRREPQALSEIPR